MLPFIPAMIPLAGSVAPMRWLKQCAASEAPRASAPGVPAAPVLPATMVFRRRAMEVPARCTPPFVFPLTVQLNISRVALPPEFELTIAALLLPEVLPLIVQLVRVSVVVPPEARE